MGKSVKGFYLFLYFLAFSLNAQDSVTPIDTKTGKVLVLPRESILAEDVTNARPNREPPPYTLLRYTERYSYLADPKNRTDYFDFLKYAPLDCTNKESYLSLGGELRERFEHYHNQSFGVTGPKINNYNWQRIMLHADLHANERLRFFVQGISALQFGGKTKTAINQNPLDLQQAFADYTFGEPTPKGSRLTIRGGRFSMTYGSGRLVATRSAPNTPLKFDGGQFIASTKGTTKLYGFMTHPVREYRNDFDRTDNSQNFIGLYATSPICDEKLSADLYYLFLKDKEASYASVSGVENRSTVGTRLFGKIGGWDYNFEPVLQFGTIEPQTIHAWTFASDTGYTFSHLGYAPRLGVKFDIASGDTSDSDNTLGTFNPLFFKAAYFNDASILRPANIIDIHPSLQFIPRDHITVTLGSDTIWRYSKNDAIYNTNGSISLPSGFNQSYLGTTLEAAVQWELNRHWVWTASYVHMLTGSYVAAAGGGDIDYLGTWFIFTF